MYKSLFKKIYLASINSILINNCFGRINGYFRKYYYVMTNIIPPIGSYYRILHLSAFKENYRILNILITSLFTVKC